jgi:hypothetical protein
MAMDLFAYRGTDWMGMFFAVISLYLLGKHRKSGFVFGVASNLSWICFSVLAESIASLVANLIYVGFNLQCWRKWKEDQSVCPGT